MCMCNVTCIWEALADVSCHTSPLTVLGSIGSSIYTAAEDGALQDCVDCRLCLQALLYVEPEGALLRQC